MRTDKPTRTHGMTAWLALPLTLALAACSPKQEPQALGEAQSAVFTNGGFETGAANAPPVGWTVQTDLNPGITLQTPQTLAGLNLVPTIAGHAAPVALTTTLNSATGPLTQVDPLLGLTGSLRWPRYGNQCAIVNKAGKNQNANVMSQTMTIGAGDVDPTDGQIHVRFVIAPVLEDPGHPADEQPYFFIQATNVTQSNAVLYSNFNFSNQAGVPWIVDNTGGTTYVYTDWQLIDIAPGSPALNMGDTVQLQLIAAGCSLGGHMGQLYVDGSGVGAVLPGLFISGTGPTQVNPGGNITYNLTYKNGSGNAETGAVITFTTPPGTTFQGFTPPAGATCVTPAVGTAGTIVCTFAGPIPAGASGGMTVTVNVTPGPTCTTTANCGAGQVCDTDAGQCVEGETGAACTTNAQCAAGQTCDVTAKLCTVGEIVAGTYQISSTQEPPLLGNKITTGVGCVVDSQCPTGQWCDESADLCKPTLPNGTTIPTDPPHAGPPLVGMCTMAAGALVCTSGVCDPSNNECGYANGDGPCTGSNGDFVCQSGVCDSDGKCGYVNGDGPCVPGVNVVVCRSTVCDTDGLCGYADGDGPCTMATSGECRSGMCSNNGDCEPMGGCNVDADCAAGTWCNEMAHMCAPQVANGKPVPSDSAHTNPTLNGMCTAAAGMLTCQSGVCDTDGDCGYANGDGPCTPGPGAAVCRSGMCSMNGTCEPMGGCNVDADCAAGTWCNEMEHMCLPQLANGTKVPTDTPHMNPTLNGTCTAAAGTLTCVSGVCDTSDNDCGYANGDGPCTDSNGDTVCRSTICATSGPNAGLCEACVMDSQCLGSTPTCNTTTNTCVQCSTSTDCPSEDPVCDTTTSTCVPCNGDNGGTTTEPCPTTGEPFCFLTGSMMGTCGKCTTDTDCQGHTGNICDTTSGLCTTGCLTDADCSSSQWCNAVAPAIGMCEPKLADGTPLPTSPSSVATCDAAVGMRVCVSGVCNTTTNTCGTGMPPGCTSDGDCPKDDFCRSDGVCTPKFADDAPCTAADQCLSGGSDNGKCDSIIASGNGLICAVRPAVGVGGGSGTDGGPLLYGMALAVAGLMRRRSSRSRSGRPQPSR